MKHKSRNQKMHIEVTTITPEMAAVMLANNPANRNIKKMHVDAIARDMAAGRWQTNGDAIRMNCDGSLIDGQHRLAACIKAGVAFDTVLITGLSADVRATIDGGAKRTHGDRLSMLGVANGMAVSATARLVGGIATGQGRTIPLTGQELDAILAAHPGIPESVRYADHAFRGLRTQLAAIHYIGHATGYGAKADAYVDVFRTGLPSYRGCAAHALRERIIKHAGSISQYSISDTIAAICSTWRHFTANTPVKTIKIVDDIRIPGWTKDRLGL
jgi:hypothetical protein